MTAQRRRNHSAGLTEALSQLTFFGRSSSRRGDPLIIGIDGRTLSAVLSLGALVESAAVGLGKKLGALALGYKPLKIVS